MERMEHLAKFFGHCWPIICIWFGLLHFFQSLSYTFFCIWQASLYSVTWYFENEEFYRYVPKESPPAIVFRVSGITVDVSIQTTYTLGILMSLIESFAFTHPQASHTQDNADEATLPRPANYLAYILWLNKLNRKLVDQRTYTQTHTHKLRNEIHDNSSKPVDKNNQHFCWMCRMHSISYILSACKKDKKAGGDFVLWLYVKIVLDFSDMLNIFHI